MRQKSGPEKQSAEDAIRDIRRATRRHFSAEEKIRIVLEGLRGEESIAELCRHEGIVSSMYYGWSKEFLEAGKRRLAGRHGARRDLRRGQGRSCGCAGLLTPKALLLSVSGPFFHKPPPRLAARTVFGTRERGGRDCQINPLLSQLLSKTEGGHPVVYDSQSFLQFLDGTQISLRGFLRIERG
jgi:transposase